MTTRNPFQAPETDFALEPQAYDGEVEGVWREGKVLVMTRDALLPPRCIKCNAPTNFRLKRRLYWHHPVVYLALLANALIYIILAVIVRKKATVHVGLCPEHKRKRFRNILIAWSIPFVGLSFGFMAAAGLDTVLLLLALSLLLIGFLWAAFSTRVVHPVRIDEREIRLKGAQEAYLASLPPPR